MAGTASPLPQRTSSRQNPIAAASQARSCPTTQPVVAVPTLHIDPTRARRAGVRRFVARGGRVVYGTDLGNQGPPPAVDTEELRLLVEAGLAPERALAAATSLAAAHLGLAGTGRVVTGARADLLLVDGDPLADLNALSRVRLVTRDGRVAGNSRR